MIPPLSIRPVVLTFKNSNNAKSAVKNLVKLGFSPKTVTIIENGSSIDIKNEIKLFSRSIGCTIFDIDTNNGWGGAINIYLESLNEQQLNSYILLIMAHDAYFTRYNRQEVLDIFNNEQLIFACPSYRVPSSARYNILKSFHEVPFRQNSFITIGQQTAFFARALHLSRVKYDEEFWVYGGEYEIFLRANKLGYLSYQLNDNTIVNPGSSLSSQYSFLAYKMNSLYYAYKRHGCVGFAIRGSVVLYNIFCLILEARFYDAWLLSKVLAYSFSNPGRGHRTYVKSLSCQRRFNIKVLNY